VVRFDRRGEPQQSYGPDVSPIEFSHAWAVGATESAVYVGDLVKERVHVFDAVDGRLRASLPFEGVIGVTFPQPGSHLWLGTHDRGATRDDPHGATAWMVDTGERIPFELPEEMFLYPAVSIHSGLNVVEVGDSLLLGFVALESLLVASRDGRVLDTLQVPVRRRRGVSAATLARHPLDTDGVVNETSRLVLMDRTSGGDLVLVHFDSQYLDSGRLATEIRVSVLGRGLDAACVDGVIDVSSLQVPNPYFHADTLWIQTSEVAGGQPSLRVRGYTIDLRGCTWLPVGPAGSLTLP